MRIPSRASHAVIGATLAAILLGSSTIALAQEETELKEQRQRLQQLQQEIKERRAQAAQLGQRQESVLRDLNQVEKELGVTKKLIHTLDGEIEQSADRITTTTRNLARAQDQLTLKRRILARRLRSIYKLGQYGNFEVLLMADSFAEILGRYKYLALIAEQDRRLVRQIERLERRIDADRRDLEGARSDLDEVRSERVAQAETLGAAERERQRALSKLKSERSEQLKAAAALEEETQRVQNLLVTLERRRAEREALARRAAAEAGRATPEPETSTLTGEFGALDWPVEGAIIERFGRAVHPVYGTEVVNNGIDIRAPRGTPIAAVEAGEVVYTDWNGGYGLMVILDHAGGYYSLYAHLDRSVVAVGQKVQKRESIGTVGESGSLVGPKLHFEIRKGGRAVDPIGWLRQR